MPPKLTVEQRIISDAKKAEYMKAYRIANSEKYDAYMRAYYLENKERCNANRTKNKRIIASKKEAEKARIIIGPKN